MQTFTLINKAKRMNIFFLDSDINKCAEYHCDKHVTKMQLEHTQMLCTTINLLSKNSVKDLYKTAHINHPCTIWTRQSKANFKLLYDLTIALNKEQLHRFGTTHKSIDVANEAFKYIHLLNDDGIAPTKKPMAMPLNYQVNNVVHSYRTYYNRNKQHIAKWTNREVPYWFNLKK